ncbi:patatin-like phospholipase family protein [Nocardia kruczakiae]|uniref:patatin-like phospholipase family protein n=1 Tax=Nocardia kruczakiae TaxID=261477 RepID=UPI00350E4CDD
MPHWPDCDLVITSVDAESGVLRAWTRTDAASVAEAVAASTAVPGVFPPIPIDGGHYADGGVRSPINADLAAGAETIVIRNPAPTSTHEPTPTTNSPRPQWFPFLQTRKPSPPQVRTSSTRPLCAPPTKRDYARARSPPRGCGGSGRRLKAAGPQESKRSRISAATRSASALRFVRSG